MNAHLEWSGKPVRKLPSQVNVYLQGSTSELYHRLAAEAGISVHRLRLTSEADGAVVPNAKDYTIERTGLKNDSVVLVKDLGEPTRVSGVALRIYVY